MKIAVTGHLGTLGKPLTAKLQSLGHEVIGIDSRHSEDGERANIAEYRQLRDVMPLDVDMVYHLAAEFGRHNGEDYYEQLWNTNVIGTKNLLRLQHAYGFKMVFSSSSEVYGEQDKTVLTEADIASHPHMLTNDYAVTKWVNESQIEMARKRWDSQTMVLRFFNAYGPGEFYHSYRSVVCLFCYRALKGMPYTVFDGYHRVFQYVDDLIDTLGQCVEDFYPQETINIGGSEYRSVVDMHNIVSDIVGVDRNRNSVSFMPEDEHNIVNKRPDISKAIALLDHSPSIQLEDGIQRTVDWMREVYQCSRS